jgi:hypothetical protein
MIWTCSKATNKFGKIADTAMKTLRETKSADKTLRLVQTANAFVGLAIEGNEIKAREDGADAEDVWRRIHDAANRLNPLFIGYSSARARFLHFFPDGFLGPDYLHRERDYKWDAKTKLEKAAWNLARVFWRRSREQTSLRSSSRCKSRHCCAGRTPTDSCAYAPTSRSVSANRPCMR